MTRECSKDCTEEVRRGAHLPEPFAVVPVLLEDGRRTWAVWTGRKWWGEHHELQVVGWQAATSAQIHLILAA